MNAETSVHGLMIKPFYDETPSFEEIIETIKSNAGCL